MVGISPSRRLETMKLTKNIQGSSGAGKTTLLDCLASRVSTGVVTGDMFVDGKLRDNSFQRQTGYVQQQDLHLEKSTIREALTFSALLRQSNEYSHQEKLDYVETVIDLLDMKEYQPAIVGVFGQGLNVEQRKRITIGVELATASALAPPHCRSALKTLGCSPARPPKTLPWS